MNRRRFLELLGSAALGSGIVYSFPSVIVSKNILLDSSIPSFTTCNMGTAGPITYSMLLKVYSRIREQSLEPDIIRVRTPYINSYYNV